MGGYLKYHSPGLRDGVLCWLRSRGPALPRPLEQSKQCPRPSVRKECRPPQLPNVIRNCGRTVLGRNSAKPSKSDSVLSKEVPNFAARDGFKIVFTVCSCASSNQGWGNFELAGRATAGKKQCRPLDILRPGAKWREFRRSSKCTVSRSKLVGFAPLHILIFTAGNPPEGQQ